MYTIDQLQKLRAEKLQVLDDVYQSRDLDDVYNRQSALGSMSISIFTDAANAVMPALKNDGVGNVVWSNISAKLEKLSFISVPTATEIREKYKESVENPTVVNVNGTPKPGTKTKVKKIPLPVFITELAAQGIAVPLLLHTICGTKLALVKILGDMVNIVFMGFEVVKYFDLLPKKRRNKTIFAAPKEGFASAANYEAMYKEAIKEVHRDNRKKLNDWFDRLEEITKEEIGKALKEMG